MSLLDTAANAGNSLLGGLFGGQTRVQFIQNSSSTVFQLDASLKETHARVSTPTKFPVEDGDTVSDHIIIEPFTLELEGIITDTPISGAAALLTEVATSVATALIPPVAVAAISTGIGALTSIFNSPSPSVAAYLQLIKLQTLKLPFDVLTSLYRYPNMWISSLSAPRDSSTGKCLIFTVQLTQLLLVTPQSVNVQILANPGLGANKGDLGEQGAQLPNGFTAGNNTANSLISSVTNGRGVSQ